MGTESNYTFFGDQPDAELAAQEKAEQTAIVNGNVAKIQDGIGIATKRESVGGNAGTEVLAGHRASCCAGPLMVNINNGEIIFFYNNDEDKGSVWSRVATEADPHAVDSVVFRLALFLGEGISDFNNQNLSKCSFVINLLNTGRLSDTAREILWRSFVEYNISQVYDEKSLWTALETINREVVVPGKKLVDIGKLKSDIESVLTGKKPIECITRAYGLRKKVVNLTYSFGKV